MKRRIQTRAGRSLAEAFTLMEIIIVILIITLLLALVTPPLVGVLEANRLTQAGQDLLFRMASARQIALTENRPVAFRFFRYADDNGVEGFHAAQLFRVDEATNADEPIDTPIYLAQGITIAEGDLSPLLAPAPGGGAGEDQPADREPFEALGATYRQVVFYPNGETSLDLPLRKAFLTVCAARSQAVAGAGPPANYYTIQIDPINGSTKTYRPQ